MFYKVRAVPVEAIYTVTPGLFEHRWTTSEATKSFKENAGRLIVDQAGLVMAHTRNVENINTAAAYTKEERMVAYKEPHLHSRPASS